MLQNRVKTAKLAALVDFKHKCKLHELYLTALVLVNSVWSSESPDMMRVAFKQTWGKPCDVLKWKRSVKLGPLPGQAL